MSTSLTLFTKVTQFFPLIQRFFVFPLSFHENTRKKNLTKKDYDSECENKRKSTTGSTY